jgi:hypothetical protein
MNNNICSINIPESFTRITVEQKEDNSLKFDLVLPNTPKIQNGMAYVRFTLTLDRAEWLETVIREFRENSSKADLKQQTLPLEVFGVNPENR